MKYLYSATLCAEWQTSLIWCASNWTPPPHTHTHTHPRHKLSVPKKMKRWKIVNAPNVFFPLFLYLFICISRKNKWKAVRLICICIDFFKYIFLWGRPAATRRGRYLWYHLYGRGQALETRLDLIMFFSRGKCLDLWPLITGRAKH